MLFQHATQNFPSFIVCQSWSYKDISKQNRMYGGFTAREVSRDQIVKANIPKNKVFGPKHPFKSIFGSWNQKTSYFYVFLCRNTIFSLFINFCLECTTNFHFFKATEIVDKVRFVKSQYLDPRTSDFAWKYLISTGIDQQKISESFMYVALTV